MGNENPSNTSSGQQSQGDPTTTPPAQGATSASQGDQSSTSRSAEELERKNAELMRENAEYRRKAREREAAQQAADEQRQKEQGDFKALAEKRETRVKELEPIAASYSKLAEQITAQIEAEIKDWPAEVKSLVPGTDVPVESRLEHIARLRPLLEKLQVQARGSQPGNGPNPQPANQQANTQRVNAANRDDLVKRRGYGI